LRPPTRVSFAGDRIQDPGITLENIIGYLAWKRIAVPSEVMTTLDTAAASIGWPGLIDVIDELKAVSTAA